MKVLWATILLMVFICFASFAAETVETPADCKQCGMNRTKFAQSRMIVTYRDGSTGTCSINCVVVDMKATRGKEVKSFQVGDYDSKKLVDAKTAVWVIGGKKKGVMTPVAKWAFADKERAETFIKVNGGRLATFDDVLKTTEKELDEPHKPKGHSGHKK